jgi:hypothetical protein
MSQSDTTAAPASSGTMSPEGQRPDSNTSPDDRATTFQPVKGGAEHYSGEVLLVTAYAALWLIILAWVALVWRKQAAMGARLDDLEKVIDEAGRAKRGSGTEAR